MSNAVSLDDSLSNFPASSREVIRLAIRLGWRAYFTKDSQHLVKCHSPKNEADFLVPSTNFNANRLRACISKIARFSDREAVLDEVERLSGERKQHVLLSALSDAAGVEKPARKHQKTAIEAAMEEAQAAITVIDPPKQETTEPHVVAEVPWLVRRGGSKGGDRGMKYESKHTLEQTMSDGSVRYKCRQCDYTHEEGKRVSWHSGKTHGANRDRSDAVMVSNYGEVEHRKFNPRLVADVLGALDSIDDWQELSPEELAKQIAEFVEEHKTHRPPAEPLTAEQMIERIRFIVDSERIGSMHEALESTRAQVAEAVAAREAAEAETAAMRAEVTRMKDSLRTLNDLVREVAGEEASTG